MSLSTCYMICAKLLLITGMMTMKNATSKIVGH
ncbi:hypothetical protein A483_HHAL011680 [Halyomorpha halys]|nr:hypothetical protein A483_HHAL011680 [Halyomorpha halys]